MNRTASRLLTTVGLLLAVFAVAADSGKPVSVKGYVIDSACAFTKNLKKPISPDCAVACAKSGSPLVILADDGTVYWPISDATPATGQNEKLLPFAGKECRSAAKFFNEADPARW